MTISYYEGNDKDSAIGKRNNNDNDENNDHNGNDDDGNDDDDNDDDDNDDDDNGNDDKNNDDDDDDILRRAVGCIWSSWDNIGRIGRSSK